MMQNPFDLKYFTKAESKEAFKRKVFCAYHPHDSQLLDEVFDDLSNACACTLFYYEPGKEPSDQAQLESDLQSMNLFVLVVTTDFLFQPCFANQVAYAFAVKHAIPVLPILFEGGLEEIFNEKIGNLQCLSKVLEKIDTTTVPYREKLRNYLSQTLSADLDMKRCFSAFDASIFLSYRKKDRKYAQQLMELIHADPACRNIAIWYDEFLIPGEDFNNGIQTELEESALFVLVVTPHIVEGDNYITLTEYPMATSLKKAVLPFELLPTDRKKLQAFCPGIEKPLATANGKQVRKAILKALRKLRVQPRKSTAERTFLIGLSYLKGICVEKNHTVGFSMILEAANSGVQEAAQVLVLLYRNGEGAQQDLEAAILWQKRLLADYQIAYQKDMRAENAHRVVNACFQLAQIQVQNKSHADAHETYDQIIAFCQTKDLSEQLFAKQSAAMAYELSGKLWMDEGEYLAAQTCCFENALKIREDLDSLDSTLQTKLAVIDVSLSMAQCCEQIGATVGVKDKVALAKKRLMLVTAVDATAENYDLIKHIMLCNRRLGQLYNTIDMWDTSAPYIQKSISLAETLCEISNTRDAKQQLMFAYMHEGERNASCSVENRCKAALEAYQKAYQIAETLRSQKETLEVQLNLGMIQEKLGHVIRRLESDDAAVPYFEKALTQLRNANRLAGSLPIKRTLYRCCFSVAKVYESMEHWDQALALLTESEMLNMEVLGGFQYRIMRTELGQTLAAMGGIYKTQWEIDKALDCLRRSHELVRQIWTEERTLRAMLIYADILKKYTSVAKLAGDFQLTDVLTAEFRCVSDKYKQAFS